MQKHTPAPWGSFDKNLPDAATDFPCVVITAPNGCPLAYVGNHAGYEANAQRIVSCVNACTGLSNTALDAGVVQELLAALEAIISVRPYTGAPLTHEEGARLLQQARAAITKATTGE